MLAHAAAGQLVDLGEGPFNLAEMQAWGTERTVRAVVLRHLLVAEQWPVDAKGVRLRGVRISGRLDLEAALLRCPLSLDCCYLDSNKPACLNFVTASRIKVAGCHLAGLTGEMLTARQLDLSGSTLTGPLELSGADITGWLSFADVKLTGTDGDGNALIGDRLKAGSMFLNRVVTGAGAVRLGGADITGQLNCRGARLTGTDSAGNALFADGLKTDGSVFLNEAVTGAGAIRLTGAEINGQLNCRGAQLTGTDGDGNALLGDRLKVGGDVLLDEGFTAAGAVRLIAADIAGQLGCSGAQLTGHNDGYALFAHGMRTGGDLSLDEGFTAAGAVWLAGAVIGGQLSCRGAQLTGHDNDGNALRADQMKARGSVLLDKGFAAVGAVRLDHADIGDLLSCSGAQLTGHTDGYAVFADGMRTGGHVLLGRAFVSAGAVWLAGAIIGGQLSCRGAQLTGTDGDGNALLADRLKVGGDVFLDEGFTAAGAVRLTAAEITGRLGCRGAQLTGTDSDGNALLANAMKVSGSVHLGGGFTAAGTITLTGAVIGGVLGCNGAQLAGNTGGGALFADGIRVGGDVVLGRGFTAAGAVRLPGADIGGWLNCSGAKLTGHDNDGSTLRADGIKVSGSVFLDDGFTAAGAVRLPGADITGQLNCSGAKLTGHDNDGSTLRADGIKVSGSVFLADAFTAAGAVVLIGADITGQLNCSGAKLTGTDSSGYALRADGIKVSGGVFLDDGFTAAGAVVLPAAQITGQLSCRGAELAGRDSSGYALRADGMKVSGSVFLDAGLTAAGSISLRSARIDGSLDLGGNLDVAQDEIALYAPVVQIVGTLRWHPVAPVRGAVNLEGAAVGELDDAWTPVTTLANGFWPTEGRLRLNGFTYGRFGGDQQANVGQRLDWIRSSRPSHMSSSPPCIVTPGRTLRLARQP